LSQAIQLERLVEQGSDGLCVSITDRPSFLFVTFECALLREMVPSAVRITVLVDPTFPLNATHPLTGRELRALRRLGIQAGQ